MPGESSAEKKARRAREKALKDMAKEQIRGEEDRYKVDHKVTTGTDSGEGAFTSEKAPDVYKVMIDKGSGAGHVQITGGGSEAFYIRTSPDQNGISMVELKNGQTCMIYGCSTVVYIRPRSS